MSYYLDLFSPETAERFSKSDRSVSGFRVRQRSSAARVKPGDILICYLTRLSRWIGLLRVESNAYEDASSLFAEENDPFTIRFKVKPIVWLPPEQGVPIRDDAIWKKLSVTKDQSKETSRWTGFFRASLNHFADADGALLAQALREQAEKPKAYPLSDDEKRALAPHVVRREGGSVVVTVPRDEVEAASKQPRESIKIQALITQIGSTMGLKIWVPASDRTAVLRECKGDKPAIVEELPLNYDKTTLDTIERIDVLWLKGRSIVRAFEVEHTTAIYSGILRMADLRSLQPNMTIALHIVAPDSRKPKVFEEILRPVFSFLEGKPLSKTCTFLSYDSIQEIAALPHLAHTSDTVLDDYAEEAEPAAA